jgi:hypothetical protein
LIVHAGDQQDGPAGFLDRDRGPFDRARIPQLAAIKWRVGNRPSGFCDGQRITAGVVLLKKWQRLAAKRPRRTGPDVAGIAVTVYQIAAGRR